MTTTMVKERPILFSGPMIRALLAGRKTQTRRIVKPQPEFGIQRCHYSPTGWAYTAAPLNGNRQVTCTCRPVLDSHGQLGDRLWVRETFLYRENKTAVVFKADLPPMTAAGLGAMYGGWKPSIHLPRRFCRLVLEITAVRVEQVRSISESDAISEGVYAIDNPDYDEDDPCGDLPRSYVAAYRELWNELNENRGYGWEETPWAWVLEFKRITPWPLTPCSTMPNLDELNLSLTYAEQSLVRCEANLEYTFNCTNCWIADAERWRVEIEQLKRRIDALTIEEAP